MKRNFALLFSCYLGLLCVFSASAQLLVTAEFAQRSSFVPYEPVFLQLQVTNQSGRPLAFGEHDGRSWLRVELTDIEGRVLSAGRGVETEPFVLRNGEKKVYEVPLHALADVTRPGNYRAIVYVYYPPLDQSFVTPPQRFRVRDGFVIWEQNIGLARDIAPEGRHRRYQLQRAQIREFQGLFLRIDEMERRRVYVTRLLGSYVDNTLPEANLDPSGVLHIIYQATPSRYVYQRVDHMGNLLEDRVMDASEGRPRMEVNQQGEVSFFGPEQIGSLDRDTDLPSLGEGLERRSLGEDLSDRPEELNFSEEE